MKELLSGNAAVAEGAWEAGCTFASAYPGTPSTETLEEFALKEGVYAEWAVNEKVAVETAIGASVGGLRVLSAMKHVGVNVAADPLYTLSYCGVQGGFVLLAADDPAMFSSQNCQDSRFHAMASHIPCLEPSDSQEALDFTKAAFELSEKFDLPFIIRSSVRVSHTKCLVEKGEKCAYEPKALTKDPGKWVMMPANAKTRRVSLIERLAAFTSWAESCAFNRIEGDGHIGVVCAGSSYQFVKDAVEGNPDFRILKLGVVYPLPKQLLIDFAASVDTLYVIDEGSDYLTQQVRACEIKVDNLPGPVKEVGELSVRDVRLALGLPVETPSSEPVNVPRPPALCPGCPHRVVYRELKRINAFVTGDIGCYTLGALAPLSSVDTVVCMGASVSMCHGLNAALTLQGNTAHQPVVAVIGDSTFAHSGLSSLISLVYNNGSGTICILDNRTTAMTGHQGNPFNGETLQHRPTRELDIEAIVKALGVEHIETVDPYDVHEVRRSLKEATAFEGIAVIVFKHPCILLDKKFQPPYVVFGCHDCRACLSIGCPALSLDRQKGSVVIDPSLCVGCGQCAQYCGFKAIVPGGSSCR